MNVILFTAVVFFSIIILFYYMEKREIRLRMQKQIEKFTSYDEEVEKLDNAPYTIDVTHYTSQVVYKITKRSLRYGDKDGDKITHVRFKNFNKEIYLDKGFEDLYIDEELPIDFEVYVKMNKGDRFITEYEVKSNNLWSNG